MVRRYQYISVGCLVGVTVVTSAKENNNPPIVKGSLIHTVQTQDTFFSNSTFLSLMQLRLADDLVRENPGVTIYKHSITTNACALGVLKRFSFVIKLQQGQPPSWRFGLASKITQPAAATVIKESLASNCSAVTFTLHGAQYKIDPNSITEVGGKKYKNIL